MILFEITETEYDPVYQTLAISNGDRQYDFLRSIVIAAIDAKRIWLSQSVIKALNFHAIACLHTSAGEFRPWLVEVGAYKPPPHFRVQALMDDFINEVNRHWETTDAVSLAAYVLWKLNYIHPFVNGNGRTARAASYFVLCLKAGGLIRGSKILPELLAANRDQYVLALQQVDAAHQAKAPNVLQPLIDLIGSLLEQQLASAPP